MYDKLIRIDEENRVIQAGTENHVSGTGWVKIGETEEWQWLPLLYNKYENCLYEYDGTEMIERDTTAEDLEVITEQLCIAINERTEIEISLGCPYVQDGIEKRLPAEDRWEAKYLMFIDKAKGGQQFSIALDTADNLDTFLITHENIEEISEAVANWKIPKVLQAQAEKRTIRQG